MIGWEALSTLWLYDCDRGFLEEAAAGLLADYIDRMDAASLLEAMRRISERLRQMTGSAEPEAEPEAKPEPAPVAADAPAVEFTPEDASANKVMGILAYLGILVFIPLFAAKESKFARFHVNQGLILFICSIVVFAIGKIPGLSTIAWLLDIAILVFAILGIINVVKGKAEKLPLIGNFRIIS